MRRPGLLGLTLLLATPAFGQEAVTVPSGQLVTLQDIILNQPGPNGLTARFRFIAPAISREGGTVDYDTASADMEHLCNSYALPRVLTQTGPRPQEVIISFADRDVIFGEAMPEATQFFESFSLNGDSCNWEAF